MKIYGVECDYTKGLLSYKGMTIATGTNKKDCIKNMVTRMKKQPTYRAYFLSAIQATDEKPEHDRKNAEKHKNWYNWSLQFYKFFNEYPKECPVCRMYGGRGLDLFWLERFLGVPKNQSISGYVQEKYSVEIVELIQSMI